MERFVASKPQGPWSLPFRLTELISHRSFDCPRRWLASILPRPRPLLVRYPAIKMGTIRSPFSHDTAAHRAPQSAKLRHSAVAIPETAHPLPIRRVGLGNVSRTELLQS